MVLLEIETRNIRLLFDLFNNPKAFSAGHDVDIPGNEKLIYKEMINDLLFCRICLIGQKSLKQKRCLPGVNGIHLNQTTPIRTILKG